MVYSNSPTRNRINDVVRARTILLAEDEPMVRKLVKSLLITDGFEVMDAVDGAEALELSRSFEGVIDLLVTDIRMPRMDGPELVRQIRKERPTIGVLVMSAYSSGEFERMSRITNFIRKPFLAKTLTQKVQAVLEDPGADLEI